MNMQVFRTSSLRVMLFSLLYFLLLSGVFLFLSFVPGYESGVLSGGVIGEMMNYAPGVILTIGVFSFFGIRQHPYPYLLALLTGGVVYVSILVSNYMVLGGWWFQDGWQINILVEVVAILIGTYIGVSIRAGKFLSGYR